MTAAGVAAGVVAYLAVGVGVTVAFFRLSGGRNEYDTPLSNGLAVVVWPVFALAGAVLALAGAVLAVSLLLALVFRLLSPRRR